MPPLDLSLYRPEPHTEGDADQIGNAFTAIQNWSQAIDLTALLSGGAFVGQGLLWNGSNWAPGNVRLAPTILSKSTQKDVVNTVAETDLLNSEFLIPANALGPNGFMLVALSGDYLNNSGSARALQLRLKIGGSNLWDGGTATAMPVSGNRRGWTALLRVWNTGASGSQAGAGVISFGSAAVAPPFGWGVLDTTGGIGGGVGGTCLEDTSTARALRFTCQHGVANASLSMRLNQADVAIEYVA